MYFKESARLAEKYPDLAGVFERLDSQLEAMGTAEVIRSSPDESALVFGRLDASQQDRIAALCGQLGNDRKNGVNHRRPQVPWE